MPWFSNSADRIIFRPLSLCSEVSPAVPLPRVFILPAFVARKLISKVHAKRLARGFEVQVAINQQSIQGEEAAGCRGRLFYGVSHLGGNAWRPKKPNRTKQNQRQRRLAPSKQPAMSERQRWALREPSRPQESRVSVRTTTRSASSGDVWHGARSVLFLAPGL